MPWPLRGPGRGDSLSNEESKKVKMPRKTYLAAAIVLATAIALLLLRPAKPKFNARILWQYENEPPYSYAVFNLTLLSAKPAVVRRMVFNARNGDTNCDVRPARPMEMGDTLKIRWPNGCGDKVVRVEIDTDRGPVYWSPASLPTRNRPLN